MAFGALRKSLVAAVGARRFISRLRKLLDSQWVLESDGRRGKGARAGARAIFGMGGVGHWPLQRGSGVVEDELRPTFFRPKLSSTGSSFRQQCQQNKCR